MGPAPLLALLALAACRPAAEPPPAPVAPPEPPAEVRPPPTRWVQRGEATPAQARLPFDGAEALVATCAGAPPCQAERWVPVDDPGAEALLLLHRGDRVEVHGGPADGPWRARWRSLSGALSGCVGEPLGRPVARDPGAARVLLQDGEDWQWLLVLSGGGPCQLTGEVRLDVRADRTDATGVRCGDRPWLEGGRACAQGHLQAWLRETALDRWEGLDEGQRALLLELLVDDPEAGAVLDALEARGVAVPARSRSD